MKKTKTGSQGRERRQDLIKKIEKLRSSRVICYVTSCRQNFAGQIASDVLRPLSLQLREIGKAKKFDLFLITNGGLVDAPWKVVTLFREYADNFNVLAPRECYSGGTLLSLGADRIITCPETLLGPVDLQIPAQDMGTSLGRTISVEDIISYLQFGRERGGLSDQAALSQMISDLGGDLNPQFLGNMYRMYLYIRSVAKKLIKSRNEDLDAVAEDRIIEMLAEKSYTHGHGIGPSEGREIGLPIDRAEGELLDAIRQLSEEYVTLFEFDVPFETPALQPGESKSMHLLQASLESTEKMHVYDSDVTIKTVYSLPQQLNIQVAPNINFPPNINPNALSQTAHQQLSSILEQFKQELESAILQQIIGQLPVQGIDYQVRDGYWKEVT